MFLNDLRIALRTLVRSPGFTLAALITLTLGIGANTTAFSIINGILLRPLPFPESERLVQVSEVSGKGTQMQVAWQNLRDWRERARGFSELVAHYPGGEATVLGLGTPLRTRVASVSEGFFRALNVNPVAGRSFAPEDHRLGAAPAGVVSHAFWRTHLNGDRDLSRHSINVDGHDLRIAGVMPPGFDHPGGTDIWIPLELQELSDSRTSHNFVVLGRLGPGVTLEQADAELDAITRGFLAANPDAAHDSGFDDYFPREARVVTLHEALVGNTRRPLSVLFGASLLVLLLACTNLASTTLARGTARGREFAVRHALGAGYARVARVIFSETLLLALVGGVLSLLLAYGVLALLPRLVPAGLPRMDAVRLDAGVATFTLLLAVGAALLSGLWPALRLSGGAMRSLRSGRGTESQHRQRVWQWLIASEVALALVLLIGAGLLMRSFWTILDVRPGFRTSGVLTATVNPPPAKYADRDARAVYYARLYDALSRVPGVERVGLVMAAPMSWVPNGLVDIEAGASATLSAEYQVADAGYFEALDIPLLRGRSFAESDREGSEHVVIVNRSLAEAAWPNQDPIGKRMTGGGMDNYWDQRKFATVIGVVGDIRQRDLTRAARPTMYFSYAQRPQRTWSMTAVIRPANGDADSQVAPIRSALAAVDGDVPVQFMTMEQRIGDALNTRRFLLTTISAFAITALLLAAVGVYGVVAYAVERRRREIGIRLALGAEPHAVRRQIQRDYLRPIGIGTLAGVATAFALSRALASLLYETPPADPLTFAAVIAILVGAGWIASFIPSLRSSRMDPLETMRAE